MYHMKNIVSFEDNIVLPKCMYHLKNPMDIYENTTDINISDQVTKFLKKMPNKQLNDLEERQDKLLQKLDTLYERIKKISSLCALNVEPTDKSVHKITPQEEIVIVLNSDNLPWYLNIFLRKVTLNVSWHIHSSVHSNRIQKIEAFFRKYEHINQNKPELKVNLRLIFKSESATPEMKISSLAIPIVGNVNTMRYLCLIYPNIVAYDYNNHEMDGLLDICHQLETASEKNKENLIAKIFLNYKSWISGDNFSIVDLATYNIIKQMQNGSKLVPKKWLSDCEKLYM